ncbi:hypothetical protein [Klebsiella phage 05F01]|nr:hypothetical protein [Klebsiella phage 05F01]
MTNIIELARSMKVASEKAKHAGESPIMPFDNRISALNEYQITVCPDNVLALVEALEKAHTKADVYDMLRDDYGLRKKGVGLADFVDWQANRIAELESRTVNIKFAPIQVEELGNVRDGKKHPYMFGAGYNSAVIHCESVIQQELDAKGIKWEAE